MVEGIDKTTFIVDRSCISCGAGRLIEVDKDDYREWLKALLAADLDKTSSIEQLSADEYSLLRHGLCDKCCKVYIAEDKRDDERRENT